MKTSKSNNTFSILTFLLFLLCFLPARIAVAEQVVYIYGKRLCNSVDIGCGGGTDLTENTREMGIGPGAGGGGGSRYFNDGTTGKSLDENRFVPGCLNEQIFIQQTLAEIAATGVPVGTIVDLGEIKDPLYNNGQWAKYETEVISSTWRRSDPKTMQRRIRIHYFFNSQTLQVSQVKLKNSFQYGCIGMAKES